MKEEQLQTNDFEKEFIFKTSRSGGKGGQNVNKVETKVLLFFHIEKSELLTEEQKTTLLKKLQKRLNSEGFVFVTEESERSQKSNKELAIKKMNLLITKSLIKPKLRKKTKIPKAVKEKRLKEKKQKSEIKKSRKKDLE